MCKNWCGIYSIRSNIAEYIKANSIENISFYGMFIRCSYLENLINESKIVTSNVYDMSYMFYNCESLKELNLSKWNTCNVYDMSYMFYDCYSLRNIDLSKFFSINAEGKEGIFYGCNLENIKVNQLV